MEWKYVKPLKSQDLIDDYECMVKYVFGNSFRNCVLEHNGGRPSRRTFDTEVKKERELKSFLSFNREDKETVWKIFEWNQDELGSRYVPFAIDHFGNLICFDANDDKIVFIHLEDISVEMIADTFDEFLDALYNE